MKLTMPQHRWNERNEFLTCKRFQYVESENRFFCNEAPHNNTLKVATPQNMYNVHNTFVSHPRQKTTYFLTNTIYLSICVSLYLSICVSIYLYLLILIQILLPGSSGEVESECREEGSWSQVGQRQASLVLRIRNHVFL